MASAATLAGVDEWNQDGHDAQHTGATTEEPWENWTFAWTWNGPDAAGGGGGHFYDAPLEGRTVVGAGNVYVPAGGKGLYALAQTDGHVVWQRSAPAFNATPAYDPGTGAVFAGGADGNLYKIRASDGLVLGTYGAGAPVNKPVTIVGSSAYVVNANGELHKVDTGTLARRWVYAACTAFCSASTSASYSPSRDALVFATGDLYVHAVRNVDGSAKWRVKPTPNPAGPTAGNPMGYTFSGGMPVIAEQHGVVLLRLQLAQDNLWSYPSPNNIFPSSFAAARSWLQSNPAEQSLFALSLDSGGTAFVPAVGYGSEEGSINGGPYGMLGTWPVVKVWPDGSEVAYMQFRAQTAQSQMDYRWDSHMGEMVLDNSTIAGLSAGDFRYVGMERNNGYVGYSGGSSYSFVTDEQNFISMSGSTLFYIEFQANTSTRILDRSASLGLAWNSPFGTARHPPVVHELVADGCNVAPNTSTHWTTCGINTLVATRYFDGPGFWEYWNVDVSPIISTNPGAYGYRPRYAYASNGLVIFEGNGGSLFVVRHAATSGGSTATSTPTPVGGSPTSTATATALPSATATATASPSATSTPTGVPSPTASPTGGLPSPTATGTPAPAPTALFADGFESGGTGQWTSTTQTGASSTVVASTVAVDVGSAGLHTAKQGTNDNGRAEVDKALAAPASKVLSLRASLRVDARSGGGGLYLQRLYADAPVYQPVASIHHNGTQYELVVRNRDASRAAVPLAVQFQAGAWYDVELVYDWSGAQPRASVYVNGAAAATYADATAGTVYAPTDVQVGLWEDDWSQQATACWDDVSVANGLQSAAGAGSSATPTPTPVATASPTATVAATASPSPTAVATASPTPSATILPSPSATPTGQPVSGPLAISTVTASSGSVALYDKFELTFDVINSVATNLQLPYDPAPPAGLAAGIGVSVEAQFLAPGQSNWSQAISQPAFLFQDYQRQQIGGRQWLYPQGSPTWRVRFAPTQQGTWQYRVRAQDASICAAGTGPCTNWAIGPSGSFSVGAARAGNHGFLRVSPTDSRYFAFSDGTPFFGQGHNDSFADTYDAGSRLATDGANGINLLRVWMTGSDIAGSAWSPWVAFGKSGYGGYLQDPGLKIAPAGSGHDFVFTLDAGSQQTCLMNGWTQGTIAVKPGTTYQLSATVQVTGVSAATAGQPAGFSVKTGGWPANNVCPGGIPVTGTVIRPTGNTTWTTLSGTLTTGASQNFLDNLFLTLDNVNAGQAFVSSVTLEEVLPGNVLGPNLLAKSQGDAHMDYSLPASWTWDNIVDQAAQQGVYLKLVVLEKNDRVWNEIKPDGTLTTADDNNNFYAAPNTKVRRLQEYFWRYLAARWGYAPGIHSWELLNEGDPYNGNHYNLANSFAQYIHQAETRRHLVTTSFWHSFPVAEFWGNQAYPDIDYADLHAYVSTGLGSYEWYPPSGMTLDTNTANTYQGSPGALQIGAGKTSGNVSLPIRGQGTWTVSAMVKAQNVVGSCPYGAPSSLAGPQIQVDVQGVGTRVVPADPNNPTQYWICTGAAGTYNYTQVSGSITVPDNAWHSLNLAFSTSYSTSGTVWYDNLVVTAPDGRQARLLGNGTFDDRERMDYDTALFNSVYSLLDGARSASGAGKPLIRGETGIDYAGGPQTELPALANDTKGVWLHNLLWGVLNPGGMYDLYWWTQNIVNNNLYFQYKPVRDFLARVPLDNGKYVDAQAQASNSSTHVTGQKDTVNGRAHLWIWNMNHTWYNVVNGIAWGQLGGTVTLPGLTPNQSYPVELWEFDNPGNLTKVTTTLTANSSGSLLIDLSSLPSTVTDLGVKVGSY